MKIIIATIVMLVLHFAVTLWLYYFAVDLLSKFVPIGAANILTFIIHMILILIYNGCPLTHVLDQHVYHLFGLEFNIEEYSIDDMWLVRGFRWIINLF